MLSLSAFLGFVIEVLIGLALICALMFAAWPSAVRRFLITLIWRGALFLARCLRRCAFAPLRLSRGMGDLAQRLEDWARALARSRMCADG
jgi:hypothetical protein